LPEVLTMPPPVALDDEDENEFVKQQVSEIERLKSKNRMLEENLRTTGNQAIKEGAQGDVQTKILRELEYLKGSNSSLNRPGSSSEEVRKLRDERDYLANENRKLQQLVTEDSAGPTSGNVKYLKQKIFHLEKELVKLEKERSQLSVRLTMTDEQLKNLQEHL
jgi:cell division protein FtsB